MTFASVFVESRLEVPIDVEEKKIYMAAGRNAKSRSTLLWHEIAINIVPFFPSLSASIYFAISSYTPTQTQK